MTENLYWAIPEKIQRRSEDMDGIFRGIEESMWKFQGSIEKEVEFLGVFKKNSMASWFLTLGISSVTHNFAEFPWMKACFPRNF